jgi:hypothetical protein
METETLNIMNTTNNNPETQPQILHRDDFALVLNTNFKVYSGEKVFQAKLNEVTELKNFPRQESFTLYFLMTEDFPLGQGNFLFEHETLIPTEVFIVPHAKVENGFIYEAVFNRLLPNK